MKSLSVAYGVKKKTKHGQTEKSEPSNDAPKGMLKTPDDIAKSIMEKRKMSKGGMVEEGSDEEPGLEGEPEVEFHSEENEPEDHMKKRQGILSSILDGMHSGKF